MNKRTGSWSILEAICLLAVLLPCMACVSCGRSTNPSIGNAETSGLLRASDSDLPLEAYSPNELLVEFRSGIDREELEAAGIDTSQPIPARRNAVLRKDVNCELLAVEIATRFGLELDNQVFLGRTRIAEFRLSDGQDMQETLQQIREAFAGFILSVSQSTLAIPAFTPDDPDYNNSGKSGGPQWYLHAMEFDEAWDVSLGDPAVLVAVIDSGCNMQHEELAGQVLDPATQFPEIEADIVNGNASIEDSYGHGTAVCGLICAATDNGRTIAGAAPGVSVLPIKATNDWLDFTIGNYIEAGYLAQQLGVDILVQSFTIYGNDSTVHGMVQDLSEDGMLLVAAAGNDADSADNWPAAWPEVLSVGAVDIGDSRSSFSNLAASVEVAAPGRDIRICGHQFNSGALAYGMEQGTSLATPLVAAAAALLWSAQPELDAGRVRELMALSGRPSTGFEGNVSVVDAGALLNLQPGLRLPELPGMILRGKNHISAGELLAPDSAQLFVAGQLSDERTAAPWSFQLDTEAALLSSAAVQLLSQFGAGQYSDEAWVLVDNTEGTYPLSEDAEAGFGNLAYFDAGQAQQQVRIGLENQFLPDWTEQSVKLYGKGQWQRIEGDSASGSHSWYCGELAKQEYDRDEFDCLVTSRLDLSGAVEPVLRFSQHYNIQDDEFGYDRASVLASTDNGETWTLLSGEGHPGWFSGYQADWELVEIPLDAYIGQTLHICFSFQSDSLLAGEQAGQPEGWWLDDIYVGEASAGSALFSLLSPQADSVYGAVNGQTGISLLLEGLQGVASMRYEIDYIPLGADRGEDQLVNSKNLTGVNIQVNSLTRPNQRFWLRATAYDADGEAGQSRLLPLYLFNRPGDVNADWLVDGNDEQLLRQSIGLKAADQGWLPWMDADQDGVVTELDLAAVAYHWTDPDGS
ncbi:S8 family serine peptidase [bacterium]|nr:S8 family serine peptidase [bacterium]